MKLLMLYGATCLNKLLVIDTKKPFQVFPGTAFLCLKDWLRLKILGYFLLLIWAMF